MVNLRNVIDNNKKCGNILGGPCINSQMLRFSCFFVEFCEIACTKYVEP